jgi:FERM C-terminal PH-like domain
MICLICGDEFEPIEPKQNICLFCFAVHETMPTHKIRAGIQVQDFDRVEFPWPSVHKIKFTEDKLILELKNGNYNPNLLKNCFNCGNKFYAFNPASNLCSSCTPVYVGQGYTITKLPNVFKSHKKHISPVFKDKLCLTCGNIFKPTHGSDKLCKNCKPSLEIKEEKQKAKIKRWVKKHKIMMENARKGIYPEPLPYVAYSSIKSTAL